MEPIKKEPLTEQEKIILSLIPSDGSKVSRKSLMEKTRMSERILRESIQTMVVKKGQPIGFSTKRNNSGYHIITDESQREEMYKTLKSYGLELLKRAKAIKNMSI